MSDLKTSIANSKSTDPKKTSAKIAVETTKSAKTSIASQTIPEKKIRSSKIVEIKTENEKPTV